MGKELILTGWGYAEYVAAAAAALRAVGGDADVRGVSRRRLPELLSELAMEDNAPRWAHIHILGVSLMGDPAALAVALAALRAKGVKVTWISAVEMPPEVVGRLAGLMEVRYLKMSLLETVAHAFGADVKDLMPFLGNVEKSPAWVRAYFTLIEAAQFCYRNYQDDSLYSTTVRYLSEDVKPAKWGQDVRRAVEHYERYGGRELIGKSREMETLRERIGRVAVHEHARVLILGESGTGKETIAQQIHTRSPRRDMPFIAFNCASVTRELLEDRFFGHERGAFTNAVERTDGLFLLADGGTLFLDEIGEMPLDVQALLLRVLEGGRFMRIGGREELKCDVRLITATNRNLPHLVREGKFRGDLFQRLNVVQLRAPALREHKDDIPAIANNWWRKCHANSVLSESQIAALMDYDYPGNVRELINILDRATALEENDFALIMREHREMNAGLWNGFGVEEDGTPDALDAAMRYHVRRVYEKCGRNIAHAAERLKISRNTVKKHLGLGGERADAIKT